ncbi:MAG: enolase C-terminal domain-like protein [Chloroflexota bacterium]
MKITDIETIAFRTTTQIRSTKWGGLVFTEPTESVQTITRIVTDQGVDGLMLGGDPAINERVIKPLLVGEDPLARERLWLWMDQLCITRHAMAERDAGIIDCALWDLYGRMVGLPLYKLLGGSRERVQAYASSFDHLGPPEVYAEQALACHALGYKAYKIHPYVFWNPHTDQPWPMTPGFPKEDVAVCRAVRQAVSDEMVLLVDPFGSYTLEESLWVGRRLEELGYYWLEQPMMETRLEAYRRLTRELAINILAPEHVPGGIFSRAEWVLQGASDMLRIDVNYGGVTGCYKLASLCQAYGIKCEMHGSGWAHLHLVAALPESTCEYYERGLLHPQQDYDRRYPYLRSICDPLDGQGNVIVPQTPGLGFDFDWEYINARRV